MGVDGAVMYDKGELETMPGSRFVRGVATLAFLLAPMAVAARLTADSVVRSPLPPERVIEATPPLPPLQLFSIQLVLDDDTFETALGVSTGQAAKQFLWFNRYSIGAQFHLEEVWVLFPDDGVVLPGFPIQIAIFRDDDADPATGAVLLRSFNSTVQAADGNAFSIYPLGVPLSVPGGTDLLIGVVPRYILSGVTPVSTPATLDTTADQGRSWVAIWNADPPDPPTLPADAVTTPIATFVPGGGNWLIRGFGTEPSVLEIPTLGFAGLAALAVALGFLSIQLVRRRSAS